MMDLSPRVRWSGRAMVVCALALTITLLPYEWIEASGLDVWNLSTLQTQIETEEHRADELLHTADQIGAVVRFRSEISADLCGGRITIAEAHTRHLELNRADSFRLERIRYHFPATNDAESTAIQIIEILKHSYELGEITSERYCELLGEAEHLREACCFHSAG